MELLEKEFPAVSPKPKAEPGRTDHAIPDDIDLGEPIIVDEQPVEVIELPQAQNKLGKFLLGLVPKPPKYPDYPRRNPISHGVEDVDEFDGLQPEPAAPAAEELFLSDPQTPEKLPEIALPEQPTEQDHQSPSTLLPESASPSLSGAEIAAKLEKDGYVKEAPRFQDQVKDKSRTNSIESTDGTGEYIIYTEHEGLVDLNNFFNDTIADLIANDPDAQISFNGGLRYAVDAAEDMQENLTYIGEKEYTEAVTGIAVYWKELLDADPKKQICALAAISGGNQVKSDAYLLEKVLGTFSSEELEHYGDRLVTNIRDLTAEPKDTEVILLDDWTISGSQIKNAYFKIATDPHFKAYAARISIQLIAAAGSLMEHGLNAMNNYYTDISERVPVKAYFKAHHTPDSSFYEHKANISGSHSSVDYDFDCTLRLLSQGSESGLVPDRRPLPKLTGIMRAYREANLPVTKSVEERAHERRRQRVVASTPSYELAPATGPPEDPYNLL